MTGYTGVKPWKAKETSAVLGPAIATVATTSSVYAQIVALTGEVQLENVLKNVTITPPSGDVEIEDTLGVDSAGFQNAELVEKPYSLATLTGTLLVTDVAKTEPFFMGSTGTAISTTETGVRYQVGQTASGKERQNSALAVKLNQVGALQSTTYKVYFALNNAFITKVGDYKLPGADGRWEVDIEAKCLPRDFYVEYMTA